MNQILMISIVFAFIFSGCTTKPEYIYLDPPKYAFSKITLDGMYVETPNKTIQKTCTPIVLEVSSLYKSIIKDFYEYQIDEYNNLNPIKRLN